MSFDRFCEGLKICLLRNQSESSKVTLGRTVIGESLSNKNIATALQENRRPPSAPLLDMPGSKQRSTPPATLRPISHITISARTLSMPQLSPERESNPTKPPTDANSVGMHNIYAMGPKKPPRSLHLNAIPDKVDKAEIRNALQNWQLGILEGTKKSMPIPEFSTQENLRETGDGQTEIYQRKPGTTRRREPRRHTLQNGIDYNMLKRLKQIEQEKEVLLQGLAAVEKAREWYLKQVNNVQDKIRYLVRTAGSTMVGSHIFFFYN